MAATTSGSIAIGLQCVCQRDRILFRPQPFPYLGYFVGAEPDTADGKGFAGPANPPSRSISFTSWAVTVNPVDLTGQCFPYIGLANGLVIGTSAIVLHHRTLEQCHAIRQFNLHVVLVIVIPGPGVTQWHLTPIVQWPR